MAAPIQRSYGLTEPMSLPATCILATANGTSTLVDLALPIAAKQVDAAGVVSWHGIAGARFFGIASGGGQNYGEWHTSTYPGLSIVLAGSWEIEAGCGARRLLGPGSLLVMLDNCGQGHRSRTVEAPCATMGIAFDDTATAAMRSLAQTALQGGNTGNG